MTILQTLFGQGYTPPMEYVGAVAKELDGADGNIYSGVFGFGESNEDPQIGDLLIAIGGASSGEFLFGSGVRASDGNEVNDVFFTRHTELGSEISLFSLEVDAANVAKAGDQIHNLWDRSVSGTQHKLLWLILARRGDSSGYPAITAFDAVNNRNSGTTAISGAHTFNRPGLTFCAYRGERSEGELVAEWDSGDAAVSGWQVLWADEDINAGGFPARQYAPHGLIMKVQPAGAASAETDFLPFDHHRIWLHLE